MSEGDEADIQFCTVVNIEAHGVRVLLVVREIGMVEASAIPMSEVGRHAVTQQLLEGVPVLPENSVQ